MDLLNNYFGIHAQSMQAREQRAELIASNLSNVDTPGYKARDINFEQVFAAQLPKPVDSSSSSLPSLNRLSPALSPSNSQPDASLTNIQYRVPLQPALDGNTVEAHVEQGEFMKNSIRYQTSLEFLNGRINGLINALRGE